MNLGDNLKKARREAGVTQSALAKELNVYQKDISRWENGVLTPSTVTFREICRILNASADAVLELK